MEGFNQLDLEEAKETVEILYEMSQILNNGLSRNTIKILMTLIDKGANPDALVNVMNEMKNQTYSKAENQNNQIEDSNPN